MGRLGGMQRLWKGHRDRTTSGTETGIVIFHTTLSKGSLLHASMFSIELVMSRASPALLGKVRKILYPTLGPNSPEFRLTWLSRIPQT